jgi:tetratricopeptide (TPR) repeat protein
MTRAVTSANLRLMGNEGFDRSKRPRDNAEAPLVRPWLLVVLGVLLLVVSGAGVTLFMHRFEIDPRTTHDQSVAARQARLQAATLVALAPLPVKDPVVHRDGADAYGYPRSYVDRSALRSLLGRGKYQELSAYIERFETDAEADFHAEYFIQDSADAFESAEHELDASLDAWVAATPDSFAPYLARGAHRFAVGFGERGFDVAKKTEHENFRAMDAAFALSFADFEHALQLEPRLMPARRDEIRIAFAGSEHRAQFATLLARAFATCGSCFVVRVTQQIALEPRWGGSYAQMATAARSANPVHNPRFSLLAGYALIDQAAQSAEDKDLNGELSLAQRADALGANADFSEELARALEDHDDDAGALRAISRAIELRPSRAELLLLRAHLYSRTKDWEPAYRDLMAGLRLAPADEQARASLPYVARGLTFVGWQAHQRGDENNAIRLLDEAAEIAPDGDVEARRVAVLTSGFHDKPEEIAALETAANAAPHDFYAHERLDYALSQGHDWPRIAAMWTAYIAANPEDGHAYYERGGTYFNEGQNAAAHADAVRGCELGVSAACVWAQRAM